MTTAAPEASMMYAPGHMETRPTQKTKPRETQNDRDYTRAQDLWRREKEAGEKIQRLREELNTARQQHGDVRRIEEQIRHAEREQIRVRQRAERLTFGPPQFGDQFLTDWHRFWNRGEGNRPNLFTAVADEFRSGGERRNVQATEPTSAERQRHPLIEKAMNIFHRRQRSNAEPTTENTTQLSAEAIEQRRRDLLDEKTEFQEEATSLRNLYDVKPNTPVEEINYINWDSIDLARFKQIQEKIARIDAELEKLNNPAQAQAETVDNRGGGVRELPQRAREIVDQLVAAFKEGGAARMQEVWKSLREKLKDDPDFRDYAVALGAKLALRAALGPIGSVGTGIVGGGIKYWADRRATNRANEGDDATAKLTTRFQNRFGERAGMNLGEIDEVVAEAGEAGETAEEQRTKWQTLKHFGRRVLEGTGQFAKDVIMAVERAGDMIVIAANHKMNQTRDIVGKYDLLPLVSTGENASPGEYEIILPPEQVEAWMVQLLEKNSNPQQKVEMLGNFSKLLRNLADLSFLDYEAPKTWGQSLADKFAITLDNGKPSSKHLEDLHELMKFAFDTHRAKLTAVVEAIPASNRKLKEQAQRELEKIIQMTDSERAPIYEQSRILEMNRRIDAVHALSIPLKAFAAESLIAIARGDVQLGGGGNETVQQLRNPLAEQSIPINRRLPEELRNNMSKLVQRPTEMRPPFGQLWGHMEQNGVKLTEHQRNFLANNFFSDADNNQAHYLEVAKGLKGDILTTEGLKAAMYRVTNPTLYGDPAFGDHTLAKDISDIKDALAQVN